MTKKEVAEELIKFDCYSYFETLTLFFYKEEEMNMMINDEMFETFLENINSKNKLICPLIIDNIDLNKLKENIQGYNKINDIKNINLFHSFLIKKKYTIIHIFEFLFN